MPMELEIQSLNTDQVRVCQNTISPNTFYMLVANALTRGHGLSVVRMGDGEKYLFEHALKGKPLDMLTPPYPINDKWLEVHGCVGISNWGVVQRLKDAAETSTYFAPNIMGIQSGVFGVASLFARRERYVDNWFCRMWSRKHQDQLLVAAKHVLFIHPLQSVRSVFAKRVAGLGVNVDCLDFHTWQQDTEVIEQARSNKAPLVLFAGGPCGKHLGPSIATGGCREKVVLDLGHAAAKEWL